jgi:hypothetical protein
LDARGDPLARAAVEQLDVEISKLEDQEPGQTTFNAGRLRPDLALGCRSRGSSQWPQRRCGLKTTPFLDLPLLAMV